MTNPKSRTLAAMSNIPPPSPDAPPDMRHDGEGRGIAMLNYGLLFASIFFAGIPALIAVALAYSRKSKVDLVLRKHFRFQIRIFWIAFFVALLAAGCGMAGVVLAVIELARSAGWAWTWDDLDLHTLQVGGDIVVLLVAAVILSLLDAAWLIVSSGLGFIRLASDRTLSKAAA
jgi:uncharacterized membrane protein